MLHLEVSCVLHTIVEYMGHVYGPEEVSNRQNIPYP
jgi:hypothetical protein